ncbi:MAG: lipid II flippase MurJ [Acidobacteriota bacterium]
MSTLTIKATNLARAGYLSVLEGGSTNRRIFKAMLTVGALSVIVKLAATLKEVAFAHRFGASDELDAFLIAFLLPSVVMNIVAGSFNAALIPTYIEVRDRDGGAAAQRLFGSVTVWTIALLIVAALMMAVAAPFVLPLLGSGFSPEKLALTERLFFLLLPVLPVSGLFVTWAAVLIAGERFVLAAIAPVLTPIAMILVLTSPGNRWGIRSAAIAQLVGAVLEGAILVVALRRQGISVVPRWHGFSPAMRQVARQYAPMIAAGSLMSGTMMVDQAMAAALGAGSVAVLNYGNKTSAAIAGIGSMAVSTAMLPHFSRMVAARDWPGIRYSLKVYTRLVLLASAAATIVFVLLSKPIIQLLFERGAFTPVDTLQVAEVQRLYILQLPVYLAGMLFVRLLSALKANRILMWGTVISFVLNIALDYVLMRWLGVAGIALSTTLVYSGSFTFLVLMTLRVLKRAGARP